MIDRRTVTVPLAWVRSLVVGLFVVAGVLTMIGLAVDRAIDNLSTVAEHVESLAAETKAQAERNAELLTLECDLQTGKPKPPPPLRRRYVNDPRLLVAHCAKEKREAEDVAGYIATVKAELQLQHTTQETNILAKLDEVKAAVERRVVPKADRIVIPGARTTSPSISSSTTKAPPVTSAKMNAVATTSTATTTTTTCPKRGKSGNCHKRG